MTDEAEIRQYVLELKNQQNSRRMPTLVTKVEPEDGATSDRASTPDHAVEGTPDMGRSRSRRYVIVCPLIVFFSQLLMIG